ncbi:substrate-binding domain-containing protein [Streptococcus hillyeri]|uniref:substrate-binding domain-containing protein n=1 Tax=Streptococcus hillyeri TaxID=2282420 RepID=UPI0034E2E108
MVGKMKQVKRHWIGFSLSLLFVGCISILYACYKYRPLNEERVKIGATYMTMNNDFYKALHSEINKEVEESGDILLLRDPSLNSDKQVEQLEYFIKEDCDVIVINPVDSSNSAIINKLKEAKRKGIAIVAVDSRLTDSKAVDTTILSDNYKAGIMCAENLLATKTSAEILLLEHETTVSGSDRIRGFLDTISGHEGYHIVASREVKGQTELAMPAVEEVINEGIAFDTIMALNDQSVLGALAAIEVGRLEGITVYGVDGSPNVKTLLASTDDVQATVAQSPHTIGEEAVRAAYRLADHLPYRSNIIVPVTLVTKENVHDFNISGWQ